MKVISLEKETKILDLHNCGYNRYTISIKLKCSKKTVNKVLSKYNLIPNTFEDLSGRKFSKLKVINFSHTKNKRKFWNCICDCGKNCTIAGVSLKRKNNPTKSCGCIDTRFKKGVEPMNKKPNGEAAFNSLYYSYKRSALTRSIEFSLSEEEFKELCENNCYYCGTLPITQKRTHSKTTGTYTYNGVDRLNPKEGYDIYNTVSCCKHCNYAKKTMNYSEFMNWCEKLCNHLLSVGDITLDEKTYLKLEKL